METLVLYAKPGSRPDGLFTEASVSQESEAGSSRRVRFGAVRPHRSRLYAKPLTDLLDTVAMFWQAEYWQGIFMPPLLSNEGE